MNLTILYNDFDDCLLYVNGTAYSDIDHTWAECIMWLKDVIGTKITIETRYIDCNRKDFPESIIYDNKGISLPITNSNKQLQCQMAITQEWIKHWSKKKDEVNKLRDIIKKIDNICGDWEWHYCPDGTPQRYISDLLVKYRY